ncbi:rhodanese-like domain-containing protein [Allofustis seminis]|uniref:rhodanese-like domain-containing protein n=1 Tax=Allofustis seminis TaxID=166939 RepID=UPI000476F915|nr:rhodanese-like domain-containing protein [Allofustis seminis]
MGTFSKTLVLFLILWGIWELVQYFRRKNAATILTKEEFNENIRKAQVIDVRESDEFKAEHILGARNIPYTELKQRYVELRNDQPIYIYDSSQFLSGKSAIFLKKKGYDNIFILEGGYENWNGRIKRSKSYHGV